MKQQVIDIKNDGIYTILELEDHTLVPLISVENFINHLLEINTNTYNNKECIYCHRNTVKLTSLNNVYYICLDCATKLVENFAQLGENISLNLNKFNPLLAKKLTDFIKGKIQADKVNFKITKQSEQDNNENKVKDGIKLQADNLVKDADIIYSSSMLINKN